MYCKKCGKEVEDDSIFCMYCGSQVDDSAMVDEEVIPGITLDESSPKDIPVRVKTNSISSVIADEIIANTKMIGYAAAVIIVFFIGFYAVRHKDKMVLDENFMFGESYYDHIAYNLPKLDSWQIRYYHDVENTKPYAQWEDVRKKLGLPDRYPRSVWDGFISEPRPISRSEEMDRSEALQKADDMAKDKGIPVEIMGEMQQSAKEEASRDSISYRDQMSSMRDGAYKDDLKGKMKWCTIISFAFFILGRYFIKVCKWVSDNATNEKE